MSIESNRPIPSRGASPRSKPWHFLPVIVGIFLASFLYRGVAAETPRVQLPSLRVHAFYYPWYGNPETDGRFENWNHAVAVRNGPPRQFPGGDDIGANFFPALGCYSVNDPAVLDIHMRQLLRSRVGVISVSWWGKDTYTDRALPLLFQAAERHGIRINFHIEPQLGSRRRDAESGA